MCVLFCDCDKTYSFNCVHDFGVKMQELLAVSFSFSFFFGFYMSVVGKIHPPPQPHCDFLGYDYLYSFSSVNPRSPDQTIHVFKAKMNSS